MKNNWDVVSAESPEWDGLVYWDDDVAPKEKVRSMKVKVGASRMTDEELRDYVNNVVASGAGKAELEDATPPFADLVVLAGECDTAFIAEGMKRDEFNAKTALRVAKCNEVRVAINSFAQSVDAIYEGDAASLQAVGLSIRNPIQPIGALPAPGNVRSYSGPMEGTIRVRWNRVRGRTHYQLECASDPNGPWSLVYSAGDVQADCGGLTSGTEYWFRVRAVGAAGPSPWSDITRRRAA